MSWWFWLAVILTSPFWMVVLIVLGYFIFVLLLGILTFIAEIIEEILKLFRKKR